MSVPASPALSDPSRLAAFERFNILDTPSEQGFEDIVELAKQICRTPVGLVSFVTDQRQWFKAKSGLALSETPLNQSVCAHAVAERTMLIIPDLSKDERTRDNPFVAGPPHIRFYAGAPLETSDGHILGTVCVIDGTPRPGGLDPAEASALAALARQVVHLLELRETIIRRDAEEHRYRMIFDAIEAAFCVVGVKFDEAGKAIDYQFLEVNSAFEKNTGIEGASGKWIRDVVPHHEEHWFERYGQVALSGKAVRFESHAEALGRWYEVYAFPAGRQGTHQVGILLNDISEQRLAQDLIREREDKLKEQQRLLNHELSHRMKNSFAMVQAIAMQTLRPVPDQKPVESFIHRLHALSAAHDLLVEQKWSAANIGEVIRGVLRKLAELKRFDIVGPEIELGPRATLSTALLLHELTTNAMKYGSLSREDGRVAVSWHLNNFNGEAELALAWREAGGPPADQPSRKGFGSKLIRMGLVGTGGVDLRYLPSGFQADFKAPLAQVQLS